MNKILSIIGLIIVILALYLYMGYYNISANEPHMNFVEDIIHEVKENSIRHHTKDIIKPAISSEQTMSTGFQHYDSMCVQCHAAPGISESEISEGLYPGPPLFPDDLEEEMGIEQIYWITKNGIKLSGMPGFGTTHSEEELWAIAAFVNELPEISEQKYQELKKKNSDHEHGTDHIHTTEDVTGDNGNTHKH